MRDIKPRCERTKATRRKYTVYHYLENSNLHKHSLSTRYPRPQTQLYNCCQSLVSVRLFNIVRIDLVRVVEFACAFTIGFRRQSYFEMERILHEHHLIKRKRLKSFSGREGEYRVEGDDHEREARD